MAALYAEAEFGRGIPVNSGDTIHNSPWSNFG